MEQELAEERVAAEAEARRAQEAIQAKQQELQQIEQQRQHEVCTSSAARIPEGDVLCDWHAIGKHERCAMIAANAIASSGALCRSGSQGISRFAGPVSLTFECFAGR